MTTEAGGGSEGGLDVVVRRSNRCEEALLDPGARLSERARRSSVGGSISIGSDLVEVRLASPRTRLSLNDLEGACACAGSTGRLVDFREDICST
jgi:hypothetical protein